MRNRVVVVLALAPLSACFEYGGESVDPAPAENVIGTALPLAHAGTLAMAILAGSPTPCAEVTAGCSAPPCAIDVGVSVGDACHLPIGEGAATGRVPVTGTMSSLDNSSLVAVFHDIDVDGDRVIVRRGAFTVSRSGRILTMAYGNQGLELVEDNVSVDQAGWTVEVDVGTTPGDTSDDRMELSGAQQIIIDSTITQVALTNVVMSPDCRRNPTAGTATFQKVGGGTEVTTLRFHAACDGKADVGVSVALDHAAFDDTVTLRWFR